MNRSSIAILCVLFVIVAGTLYFGYFKLQQIGQPSISHQETTQQRVERKEIQTDVVEEDKVILKTGESFSGEIINQTDESIEIRPTAVGSVDITYTFTYDKIEDIVLGRHKIERLLNNPLMSGYFEVEKYKDHIFALYRNEQFDELETEIASLRTAKKRFATGEWKLDIFYRAIILKSDSEFIPALEENIETLEKWKKYFPRSVTPIILLINAHKNLAWQYRGETTSSGVSKKGNRNFQQHLTIAKHYIDSVDEETAELDPRFQYAKIAVNVGLGTLGEELARILNKSLTYDPEYYSTYTKIAPFLMPRWGGRPGVVEIYAERVSTLTEGEEMYARVADSIRGYAEESAYRRFAFDWNRVKSGFEDMSRKYPLNFYLLHANMWMACYYGDYELLRKLSDRNGYTWNQQAHDVWKSFSSYYSCRKRANLSTAAGGVDLHREVRKGNYERFVELLNGDVDLNAKGDDEETVLTFAVRTGFLDFAVALIEAGADIEMMSSSGVQPMHMAARNGAVKMVSFLVERGASANARTGQGRWAPLHYAARYGHNDTVRYLLGRKDIEVNAETSAGMTPLHLAVGIGNQMIVGLLLDKKSIDVNVVSDDNETPLNVARANGYEEISRLLEFRGAKANSNVVSREDRDRARDLVDKGIEEHGKREYAKAKVFYLQAIEVDPNFSIAYGNIALVNMFENNYQACFDNVTKAIELDNGNAHAYYSAAQCLFMLRKPTEEYLPYYRRYTELEPDNFRTKELYQKYPELKAAVN